MAWLGAAPRIAETSTSTGTGDFALAGAYDSTYGRASRAASTADTFKYVIFADDGKVERGLGTYSAANTLTRTTPQKGWNGSAWVTNTLVSFSAGAKVVFIDHPEVEEVINNATAKTTMADSDKVPLTDSAASNVLKYITWANLATAVWTKLGALIAAGSNKATIVAADMLAIADSAASNATKYITFTNLMTFIASFTQTMTNKRVTPRLDAITSSATPTINSDTTDIYRITALAVNITSMTSGLTGTPAHGDVLAYEITGTATRTIAWGTSYEASTVPLPTGTVGTAMLQAFFTWNSATSKWRCVGVC